MSGEANRQFPWPGIFGIVVHLVRLVLAGLFIYAGAIKLIQPNTFLSDIESYRMLPYSLAWLTSFYLPPLEIFSGLGLLWAGTRRASATILVGLMVVFLFAIVGAWLRGLDISCGCFGTSGGETNYLWLVIRDLLILGGLLFSIRGPFKRTPHPGSSKQSGFG